MMIDRTVTAADILTKAIEGWQGGKKWCQGTGRTADGKTCLIIGIDDARCDLNASSHAIEQAYEAIRALTPSPYLPAQWNNQRGRTFEDVLLLVEQARANLKAKED